MDARALKPLIDSLLDSAAENASSEGNVSVSLLRAFAVNVTEQVENLMSVISQAVADISFELLTLEQRCTEERREDMSAVWELTSRTNSLEELSLTTVMVEEQLKRLNAVEVRESEIMRVIVMLEQRLNILENPEKQVQ